MPYIENFISDVNNLLQQLYGFNYLIELDVKELCKANIAAILDNQISSAEAISEKLNEFYIKYKAGDILEKG